MDLEKIFDGWIGEHGTNSYIVVCEECKRLFSACPRVPGDASPRSIFVPRAASPRSIFGPRAEP